VTLTSLIPSYPVRLLRIRQKRKENVVTFQGLMLECVFSVDTFHTSYRNRLSTAKFLLRIPDVPGSNLDSEILRSQTMTEKLK
jgi:hypothetical protein